ncbi:MAG TPA: hemerythrin domain-containing protein [Bacteroidia bacterium]|nr:hemerythrin domain-containing protein [Bacteroidia bacterium]
MKTAQPLKRNPALVRFSQDHHYALLCVWKIREGLRKTVSAERISRYVLHFFETDLQHHLTEEEEKVFAKLPKDNAMRIEAQEQHKEIFLLVKELKQNPGDRNLLENFADTLEKYIHFEERRLFHYLQQVLSDNELDRISKTTVSAVHEPEEAWSDVFWK